MPKPGSASRGLRRTLGRFLPIEARIARRRFSAPRRQRYTYVRKRLSRRADTMARGRQAGSVCAVTMVRDEADILDATLSHLSRQGIDSLIIVDHNSRDGTPDIIAKHSERLPTTWFSLTGEARYQAETMTLLAQLARSRGARWILPFDADEFWFAEERLLGDELRRSSAPMRTARVHNAFPTRETADRGLADFRLDLTAHRHTKVAARAARALHIKEGNHDAERRGARQDGLMVLHYPWRSFEQFVRKVRQGKSSYDATDLPPWAGHHHRHLGGLPDQRLRAIWCGILDGVHDPSIDWSPVGPFRDGIDPSGVVCGNDLLR